MRNFFNTTLVVLILTLCVDALATTHYSTINSFAPATRQDHFSALEEGSTLTKKNFNFYIFADVPYKSLTVYSEIEGEDILSFLHIGASYGLTSRLELGVRGQAIVSELNNDEQLSMRLSNKGFSNFDGFLKYSFFQGSKVQAAAKLNVGSVSGSNIFFEGPNSGLNYSIDIDLSATFKKWVFAINAGYLKRTPGDRDPAFAFFEPIESSIIANIGISRIISEKMNIRLEVINASHDITFEGDNREDFSSEAILSLRRKINKFNLVVGGSFGLTDGVSVPTARGFLGLGYRFGPRKKKVEPVVEEEVLIEEEPVEIEEPIEEPVFEDEPVEELIEETVEEPVYIEEEPIEELIEEPVYIEEEPIEEIAPAAPAVDQKFILNNIEFAFDSYELRSDSQASLDELYNYLETNNYETIEIWGHTDFIGSLEYNEYLGLSRAKAVYDYLTRLGISPNVMKYDSFGERKPVNTGLTNDYRRKNRRVEIILIK